MAKEKLDEQVVQPAPGAAPVDTVAAEEEGQLVAARANTDTNVRVQLVGATNFTIIICAAF